MQKQLIQTLKILLASVVLSFGISYAYAWVGPASAPPTGNTNPPLVSTTNTTAIQTTEGKLVANAGLATMGNVITANDVNALNYCDENGNNCVAGSALGGAAGKWNDVVGGISYSGGNVGIGTGAAAPAAELEVMGHVVANDNDADFVQLWKDGAIISGFGGSLDGLRFGFANDLNAGGWSEKMRITEAGNVGIGTASPGVALDVNGSVRASGGVYINNKKFSKIKYVNLGEDIYNEVGNWTVYPDTCNGNATLQYSCGVTTEITSCRDTYKSGPWNSVTLTRFVTCYANGYPIIY